ncbi:hypothetical protein KIL84_011290 [Mauremys mutica]|uniref:Uncharacterized protein n=1 Tax=Mauremys mutica TaxID=74926 RepID=A0A9D3XD48_9SAUR|nr:hypothetical protein KIL84_011290 [Mauremys mutica]
MVKVCSNIISKVMNSPRVILLVQNQTALPRQKLLNRPVLNKGMSLYISSKEHPQNSRGRRWQENSTIGISANTSGERKSIESPSPPDSMSPSSLPHFLNKLYFEG